MVLDHTRSNVQLLLARLMLVPLDRRGDDWGIYGRFERNAFGTGLLLRGPREALKLHLRRVGREWEWG